MQCRTQICQSIRHNKYCHRYRHQSSHYPDSDPSPPPLALSLRQKLRILTFLCLNVFQVVICIIRTSGNVQRGGDKISFGVAYSFSFLLIQIEAGVAVLMGGVTALRSVFASLERERRRRSSEQSSSTMFRRMIYWYKHSRDKNKSNAEQLQEIVGRNKSLPAIPTEGGPLRGLQTCIRKFGRASGLTTYNSTVLRSQYDPLNSYHDCIKPTIKPTQTQRFTLRLNGLNEESGHKVRYEG
jgi:hypothetical protein